MANSISIDAVDKVSITILVDNKADLIVKSTESVKYFTDKPLLAEHGFSVLVNTGSPDESILWDAGVTERTLIENMHRMNVDFQQIRTIALSHGHWDHYSAMTAVLYEMGLSPEPKNWGKAFKQEEIESWLKQNQVNIITHPAAMRERWWRKKDQTLQGPFSPPPSQAWEAAGAKVVLSEGPYELTKGCWTTGYVPRTSFEKAGRSPQSLYREGPDLLPDDTEEDQAIVIHVKNKGLVVLSGCAHSGIVNTIYQAQAITGVSRIYAIVGGFHLAGAKDSDLSSTIELIKKENPAYVIPHHCTGFKAMTRFAQEMPDAFIEGIVGATYHF